MNGGDDCSGVDRGGRPAVTPVPVGWQRRVEEGRVCYISGTSLASLEQTRAYLLADGTCKCGLECPLNVHKVFNFDPAAMVTGSEAAKAEEDMTKLCNHRRKIVAMATLYRSMESHGPLGLPHLGPGATSASPLTPKAPPAASPVATSAMEGVALGCPLPSGTDPFPFLAQEQALPFGNALPPGLLPLGSFPFSLTLGPETPLPPLSLQGEPEGQPLLPLVLPNLDLLQQQSGLLASLLALPEATCEGEREGVAAEPLLEPFAGLPDALQPLLFPALSTPPAVLALNSALLATSLGPSDAGLGPTQTGLASTPVAPTSTSTTSTTTEGTPSAMGRLNSLMPQLVNPLLSTTLLGDLSALNTASGPSLIGSPLLQAQQPLLPPSMQGPLGLQLLQGQLPLLAGSNPLACLLQSLQLNPGFGAPEKPMLPSEAPAPAMTSMAPVPETELGPSAVLPPCMDAAPTIDFAFKMKANMKCKFHNLSEINGILDSSHPQKDVPD
ncbi:Methyl-CpG-binding domain protein 6 [Varanus komodoensis]|nr:Methyl-CpG-binding domain protein 6 [Varanus komodoensis]